LLYVDVGLCTCLKELDVVLLGKLRALVSIHNPSVGHVALVADQDLVDALARVLLNVSDPVADVFGKREKKAKGKKVRNNRRTRHKNCILSNDF